LDAGGGESVGIVSTVEKTGVFFLTYEGEMGLGNFRGAKAAGSGSTMSFNVQDPAIVAQLQKARDDQAPIKVTYRVVAGHYPWKQEHSHIITKVEPLAAHIVRAINTGLPEGDAEPAPTLPVGKGTVMLQCIPVQK
jgi:hypothetical protein